MKSILSSKPELLFSQGMWSNTTIMVACQYGQAIIAGLLLDYLECFLTGDSYKNGSDKGESEVQLVREQISRNAFANASPAFSLHHHEEEQRRKNVQQLLNHRSEKGACALLLACMGTLLSWLCLDVANLFVL